jgi:hypothetical protein
LCILLVACLFAMLFYLLLFSLLWALLIYHTGHAVPGMEATMRSSLVHLVYKGDFRAPPESAAYESEFLESVAI